MASKRAADLRTTPGLIKELAKQRDELIRHFETIIALASSEKADRNAAAQEGFQMKVSTSQLISAAEDLQTLIRNLQEMWLFGQLDTIGQSEAQTKTDENAKVVGELLEKLSQRQGAAPTTDGDAQMQTRDAADPA